jgi:hypothetical protein
MTTTISIPTAEYNRAKAYAKERNLSIEELFVTLLGQLTSEEDTTWDKHDTPEKPYTQEELMARIDEGERQFEQGEYKAHEQLMSELKEEFSWLK